MSHIVACVRVKVPECPARLPTKWIEDLEQNQQIASCCRHPENHEIEAFYSSEDWKNGPDGQSNPPDIYIFYCTCGRKHRRFCTGGSTAPDGRVTHARPFWDIR